MKSLVTIFSIMALVLASTAFAEPIQNPAGAAATSIYAAAGTASVAVYTSGLKADRNTKKAFILVGYSSAGVTQLTTLPGTAVIQVGPTSTGPWVTAKDVNGTSLSGLTSSGAFLIDSLNQWYRLSWTKTGTDTRTLNAWMLTADK